MRDEEKRVKPEEIYFPTRKNDLIKNWERIVIEKDEDGRESFIVYVKRDESFKQFFDFVVLEIGMWALDKKPIECDVYCWGTCFSDGIRHFYVGSPQTNNVAYLHYLHIGEMKLVLDSLAKIMKESGIENK